MSAALSGSTAQDALHQRAEELFARQERSLCAHTDQLFAKLMILQWLAAIVCALWISPRAWAGTASWVHPHVWVAAGLVGVVSALPVWLAWRYPAMPATRYTVAAAQMLTSALLIHLSGGRIETHFHVFGSLAFLAFYRDWKVFIPATLVIATDHFIRGMFWPESVFGSAVASPWRWLEHAAWVLFEVTFLVLAVRQSVREMHGLARQQAQLEGTHQLVEAEVIARTKELEELQQRHLEVARRAGMAEIATSVLHNVGNILNSVNISASTIGEKLRAAGVSDLRRAADLLQAHVGDASEFLSSDKRGRHLPGFLVELSRQMACDEETILEEVESLSKNIDYIKDIVVVQQTYAGVAGFVEEVSLEELVEDAIRIQLASFGRHRIEILRSMEPMPKALLARQKFLQIVVNLLSNAKNAVMECNNPDRRITVRLSSCTDERARLEVEDSGVGIPEENLTRIFAHGFTTRREGHGFGLHSAANLASEMDGTLQAASRGPGCGATFTFEFPLRPVGVMSCLTATV